MILALGITILGNQSVNVSLLYVVLHLMMYKYEPTICTYMGFFVGFVCCFFFSFSEATRAGYSILVLLLVLLFVSLVAVGLLLLWKYHKTIKYCSQPPLEIPSHFEEVCVDIFCFFPPAPLPL